MLNLNGVRRSWGMVNDVDDLDVDLVGDCEPTTSNLVELHKIILDRVMER